MLAAALLCLLSGCTTSSAVRSQAHGGAPETAGTPTATASAQIAAASEQVANTERAFAQTLANRDLKAFLAFLSPDAIFFSGSNVEHGPAEIAEVWAPFFSGPRAPFSWHPDHVEVTADGQLALSTGPVLQDDKVVGRFNSVWRLEDGKTWRILFDKGEQVCGAPDRHVTRSPDSN
jgi:ketosteroid isomerase-like protein